MCISNELYCFEVKQNNPVELYTQALSAQRWSIATIIHDMHRVLVT